MLANFFGAFISDRVGRRRILCKGTHSANDVRSLTVLVVGFIAITCMLSIATALIAKYNETPTRGWAGVALTFLFLYVTWYGRFHPPRDIKLADLWHSHGICIDPIVWVVAAEVFPTHLRGQGAAISMSAVFLVDVLWLQLAPTATATIGWKYYLVFIALGVVHSIFFWFKLPEASVSTQSAWTYFNSDCRQAASRWRTWICFSASSPPATNMMGGIAWKEKRASALERRRLLPKALLPASNSSSLPLRQFRAVLEQAFCCLLPSALDFQSSCKADSWVSLAILQDSPLPRRLNFMWHIYSLLGAFLFGRPCSNSTTPQERERSVRYF